MLISWAAVAQESSKSASERACETDNEASPELIDVTMGGVDMDG